MLNFAFWSSFTVLQGIITHEMLRITIKNARRENKILNGKVQALTSLCPFLSAYPGPGCEGSSRSPNDPLPSNFLKLIWWNIKHFSLTISSLFTISLSCLTSVQRLHCSPSQFKHILLFHISYHCILHVKMTVIARCCYLWYNFLASSHGCLRIWIFFFF